jgi:hypothetical protein
MPVKKTKREGTVGAYWFAKYEKDGLVYPGTGGEPGWRDGEERTVEHPERVRLCAWGYHAADNWWTALQDAPGPIACQVRLEVTDQEDDGKLVGPRSVLVAHVDASLELRLVAAEFRAVARMHKGRLGAWQLRSEIDKQTLKGVAAVAADAAISYAAWWRAYAAAYGAATGAYPAAAVDAVYLTAATAYTAAAAVDFSTAYKAADAAATVDRAWQAEHLSYWMEQAFARKGEGAGG